MTLVAFIKYNINKEGGAEMKRNPVVKEAIECYEENELIFASKLYREKLYDRISEQAYYKTLGRMCESGELVRIAKGTYHRPKISRYGIVPPSEKEIVSALTDYNMGTVIGYTLYNNLNLTTQISKTVDVLSSALDGFSKSLRNVVVHKVDVEYTEEVNNMIHGLEVLQNYYRIQDMNYSNFIAFTKEFALSYNSEAFKVVIENINYKKSTISFLREILNYYDVKNNLDMYLSALSDYKHPRMEDIYEAAQISG